MGYSYDMAGRLACDSCGDVGGVRKRTCPYKVGPPGALLPYCYPSALCQPCYMKHGGSAKIHEGCKAGAARRQQEYDTTAARLDAGELIRRAAWGDWCGTVPPCFVGVYFEGKSGTSAYLLMPSAVYGSIPLRQAASPDDYARRADDMRLPRPSHWDGPEGGATTKERPLVPAPSKPAPWPGPAPTVGVQHDLIPGTFPGGRLFPE